ncbi:hypothetical protein LCGC14_0599790 [marine sediment metagenome]|uniref:Uncharacterized protein n=1 Tax=marine sediment metagenome TaxID=412755 RepID=A0A0F9RFS6_9ZZZZ
MAQSDYTVGVRTKYSKVGVTLADFVHQFCDHKDDCDKTCPLRPRTQAKQFIKDKKVDVAYADERHCERFRHTEGGMPGATIREVGVWK